MIKGITKNISLSPIPYKDLNPEETFVPFQIDLRNGRLTDAENRKKLGMHGNVSVEYIPILFDGVGLNGRTKS